ncbi:hypothetical protein BDA99DRAFT_540498 [Phascolomyces articulosus]|uniref:Uncharacterized protein n=1 Tax=Phascolomyces articulosus TaxID=60185 RepID=A0AAD5PAK8_9FUNG|nr:hypothetical protein BDA99DRAFT_540498 [Phascolomyces articulosus]
MIYIILTKRTLHIKEFQELIDAKYFFFKPSLFTLFFVDLKCLTGLRKKNCALVEIKTIPTCFLAIYCKVLKHRHIESAYYQHYRLFFQTIKLYVNNGTKTSFGEIIFQETSTKLGNTSKEVNHTPQQCQELFNTHLSYKEILRGKREALLP